MSSTTTQRHRLPQLTGPIYIGDGGLETAMIFLDGIDLPDFAAFPLLDDEAGRAALDRYYQGFFDIAERHGTGIVVDTPTWRANADWGRRLGYDADALAAVNRRAVDYVRGLIDSRPGIPTVLNGAIGPRGDGYVIGDTMSAGEATRYHSLQTRAFADAGADMTTAVTLTYAEEAIGVVRAATDVGLPVAIGFTVETDGRLPSGQPLGEAFEAVDAATGSAAAYFMVNCAHTSHFRDSLTEGAPWLDRVKAIRANASRMSHAELDEAEELDRGDPVGLAGDYAELYRVLPDLRVVGGCCGTDHEHVERIARALTA